MSNLLLVKPEKLDKIQKPIDEAKYFQWKETLDLDIEHHFNFKNISLPGLYGMRLLQRLKTTDPFIVVK